MSILSVQSISLIFAGAINLVLASLIYLRERGNQSHTLFALIGVSVSAWAFTRAFFEIAIKRDVAFIWATLLYLSAASIPIFFLLFTYTFPLAKIPLSLTKRILLTIPGIFAIILVITDSAIVTDIGMTPIKTISFGNWYPYYFAYIVTYFLWGFLNITQKYKKSAGILRTQLLYIFLGTFIATVFGITTNLILPTFGYFIFFGIGPITTVVMVVFIFYAIMKHNLLNIKIITTELFTATILLILFAETFFVASPLQLTVKVIVLILASIFGYLIIRSSLQEVKTREQIEQLASDLQNVNTELERVSTAKSDFLSIASHQLKTPLSIIKGYVSMTMEGSFGKVSKMMHEQLQKVYSSNERLITLVDDLLNLSRIEDGRMEYDLKEEDLSDIITSVVEELTTNAKAKHLKILWHAPKEAIAVHVDRNKIRNVIFNLVDNAIKYTDKGTVTVTLNRTDHRAVLTVSDTGRGIVPEDIGKLFQKFTRAKNAKPNERSTAVFGFGLGLYVARLIVEAHHGTIRAESKGAEKGSAFVVELPVAG